MTHGGHEMNSGKRMKEKQGMKAILVVLDGAADRPVAALDGETPLEHASLPHLDKMAFKGACGIMDVVEPGIPGGSDTSQMTFLGNDAREYYTGRGALEAIGGGINVKDGDICFRTNFATVSKDEAGRYIVRDRRAGRNIPRAGEIRDLIVDTFQPPFDNVEVKFIHTTQHRGALVIRGRNLTHEVNGTDPHRVDVPVESIETDAGASEKRQRMKVIIETFQDHVFNLLDGHEINASRRDEGMPPVNMVLVRGGGILPELPQFQRKWGIKGSFICGNALIAGVCLVSGLDPALDTKDTDYQLKMQELERTLTTHDFVFFHVKETDNCSHDKDPEGVVQELEEIDEKVFSRLEQFDEKNTIIAVTADHTTSSETGRHRGDPVPVLFWGRGVRPDSIRTFNEAACAEGGVNRIRGKNLMPLILNHIDITGKFGS
ncbi:2,3-bisphosphoglycerate-independent phosphoglycerate mutase [Candidatus Bathyarchaeota archaeon]|nr:2,3-bisphosphoglycerate-independent phosphoglycerate mutase [Candidatus Bathyarchaeota archaeon]